MDIDGAAGAAGAAHAAGAAGANGEPAPSTACRALPAVTAPVFEVLGDLVPGAHRASGGYQTVPETLSFNGNAIVGASYTEGDEGHAYIWTHDAGLKDLRTDDNDLNDALGTNCDGSVVFATDDPGATFRLADGEPPLQLLPEPDGPDDVWIRSSDANGQVAVGATGGSDEEASAVRWVGSTAEGMALGVHGYATDVSANGDVIVGVRYVGADVAAIFRWTEEEGATDLAPAGARMAQISADGTSVIALHPSGLPFRWRESGTTELPCAESQSSCLPDLINHDGSVVILSGPAPDYETMVWTQAKGTVSFDAAITAAGASLGSWTHLNVVDMSADAQVFTGLAFADDGSTATYRLRVPAGTF